MNEPERPRFFIHTSYHVWTVIDRIKDGRSDGAVMHFGARGRGDAAARQAAYDFRDGANDGLHDHRNESRGSDYASGWRHGFSVRMNDCHNFDLPEVKYPACDA